MSPEDTEQSNAHLPEGEENARMTDAPHKKKKKKKGKGGKMQQQQPQRESDSAIGSGKDNNDTEMENSEATPQQKRGRQ